MVMEAEGGGQWLEDCRYLSKTVMEFYTWRLLCEANGKILTVFTICLNCLYAKVIQSDWKTGKKQKAKLSGLHTGWDWLPEHFCWFLPFKSCMLHAFVFKEPASTVLEISLFTISLFPSYCSQEISYFCYKYISAYCIPNHTFPRYIVWLTKKLICYTLFMCHLHRQADTYGPHHNPSICVSVCRTLCWAVLWYALSWIPYHQSLEVCVLLV